MLMVEMFDSFPTYATLKKFRLCMLIGNANGLKIRCFSVRVRAQAPKHRYSLMVKQSPYKG